MLAEDECCASNSKDHSSDADGVADPEVEDERGQEVVGYDYSYVEEDNTAVDEGLGVLGVEFFDVGHVVVDEEPVRTVDAVHTDQYEEGQDLFP